MGLRQRVLIAVTVAVVGLMLTALLPLAIPPSPGPLALALSGIFAVAWGGVYYAALGRGVSWVRLIVIQFLTLLAIFWPLMRATGSPFLSGVVSAVVVLCFWMLPVGVVATQLFFSGGQNPPPSSSDGLPPDA